jgi:hypothetical protein
MEGKGPNIRYIDIDGLIRKTFIQDGHSIRADSNSGFN